MGEGGLGVCGSRGGVGAGVGQLTEKEERLLKLIKGMSNVGEREGAGRRPGARRLFGVPTYF